MNWVKRLWVYQFVMWVKPSFEDADGTASYRRISAFVFVCLICYMIIWDKISSDLKLNAFYALLVTFLLLVGIVTTQNVLTFFRANKIEPEPKQNEETLKNGDNVTITKE